MEINDNTKKASMNSQLKCKQTTGGGSLQQFLVITVFSGSQLQIKTSWKYLSQKMNKIQVTFLYPILMSYYGSVKVSIFAELYLTSEAYLFS